MNMRLDSHHRPVHSPSFHGSPAGRMGGGEGAGPGRGPAPLGAAPWRGYRPGEQAASEAPTQVLGFRVGPQGPHGASPYPQSELPAPSTPVQTRTPPHGRGFAHRTAQVLAAGVLAASAVGFGFGTHFATEAVTDLRAPDYTAAQVQEQHRDGARTQVAREASIGWAIQEAGDNDGAIERLETLGGNAKGKTSEAKADAFSQNVADVLNEERRDDALLNGGLGLVAGAASWTSLQSAARMLFRGRRSKES